MLHPQARTVIIRTTPLTLGSQIVAFNKALHIKILNARVLGNLCKYHHKSYIAKKIDSLNCILVADHFYVIGPKDTEFGRIPQNNGRYAVQGHSRSPILVYQSRAIFDFLLLINTNLHPISHDLQVIADYWSNLRYRHVSLLITLVLSAPLKSEPRNLPSRN